MTDDPKKEPAANPFAEMLARLAEQEQSTTPAAKGEVSERVESLLGALGESILGDWPAVEELRKLPPDEFAALCRQLSLFIERLAALRSELLLGRGPRL
jgi:hypothetical protein